MQKKYQKITVSKILQGLAGCDFYDFNGSSGGRCGRCGGGCGCGAGHCFPIDDIRVVVGELSDNATAGKLGKANSSLQQRGNAPNQ